MKKTVWINIGYFSRTHGLKGGLVLTHVQDWEVQPDVFYIPSGESYKPYEVESISSRPDLSFVKLRGIDTLDAAQSFRGVGVFLPKAELVQRERDVFFDEEIIGFHIQDRTLGRIGAVKRVAHDGGRRYLLVERDQGRELILPDEPAFILRIDKRSKAIHTDLPEGFLSL